MINVWINHIGIYDHLTPRLQELLYEAKRFKAANNYKYCWAKKSVIYLRQNDTSRIIKLNRMDNLATMIPKNAATAQISDAQNADE